MKNFSVLSSVEIKAKSYTTKPHQYKRDVLIHKIDLCNRAFTLNIMVDGEHIHL